MRSLDRNIIFVAIVLKSEKVAETIKAAIAANPFTSLSQGEGCNNVDLAKDIGQEDYG